MTEDPDRAAVHWLLLMNGCSCVAPPLQCTVGNTPVVLLETSIWLRRSGGDASD